MAVLVQTLRFAQATTCSFCNSGMLANQKIYEDEHGLILYDYKPAIKGHRLVL